MHSTSFYSDNYIRLLNILCYIFNQILCYWCASVKINVWCSWNRFWKQSWFCLRTLVLKLDHYWKRSECCNYSHNAIRLSTVLCIAILLTSYCDFFHSPWSIFRLDVTDFDQVISVSPTSTLIMAQYSVTSSRVLKMGGNFFTLAPPQPFLGEPSLPGSLSILFLHLFQKGILGISGKRVLTHWIPFMSPNRRCQSSPYTMISVSKRPFSTGWPINRFHLRLWIFRYFCATDKTKCCGSCWQH